MIKRASYWLSTGLLAAAMLSGGLAELILRPETVQGMSELGYPAATSTVAEAYYGRGYLPAHCEEVGPGPPHHTQASARN